MYIATYPDAILRTKCEKVDLDTEMEFAENICNKMGRVIDDFKAIGLAANQLDYNKRIIAVRPSGITETKFMINPVIIEAAGTMIGDEACLSLPGVLIKIKRSAIVVVEYFSLKADKIVQEELMSQECIIVQHESDHLDGITLAQSAPRALRQQLMGQLKAGKKGFAKALERNTKLAKRAKQMAELSDEALEEAVQKQYGTTGQISSFHEKLMYK